MNNALEGIHRITEAEECINDLEDRIVKITAKEQNIEKEWKEMKTGWENIKHTNPRIIRVPERGERERTWENIWRDNSWNFPNVGKEIAYQL